MSAYAVNEMLTHLSWVEKSKVNALPSHSLGVVGVI